MGILKNLLVTGSSKFINVIKGTVQSSQNGIFYGTCTTAAGTRTKVITLQNSDGFELVKGVMIGVKFTNTNTYSSTTSSPVTLNVNKTGAKNIWYNTTHSGAGNTGTLTAAYGYANRFIYYMYDGTYWVWVNNDTNDAASVNGHSVTTTVADNSSLPTGSAIVSYVDSAPKEITVDCGTFSALPITVEDSRITSDMGFSGYFELSDDTVKTDVWTVDTYDGYLTINGTITGETSMVLRLVRVATS